MKYYKSLLVFTLAGSLVPGLLADEDPQSTPYINLEPAPLISSPETSPDPAPSTFVYSPLTLRENYMYGFNRVFSPGKLILFGIKAGMDQERRMPNKWGEGAASYGERYATHFGRALIRENLAFDVRALDGEDPRYELSHDTGVWKRSKHAIARTFLVRNRDGELMPAYSRIISNFATPFIAEQWQPDGPNTARALRMGAGGIGLAVAANIGMEFWPDLRRKFLHR